MSERVTRYDFGTFRGKAQRTPQGFLRVKANLTRTGVFEYKLSNGTIRRELRPPEEVFHEDSLATMGGVSVTDQHPSSFVNPINVGSFQKGFVSETVKASGKFVAADVIVQDHRLIKSVEAGDRSDVSMGYSARIDSTPGVWGGKPYDVVQREIRYNHAALCPKGWGRMGTEVSLHMDGADAEDQTLAVQVRTDDFPPEVEPELKRKEKTMETSTLRVDGVDYEVEKTTQKHLDKAFAERTARIDELEAQLKSSKDESVKAVAERDELKAEIEKLQDPKARQDAVTARLDLERKAKMFMKDEDFSGVEDLDVMRKVISSRHDKLDSVKLEDDVYVKARFDVLVDMADQVPGAGKKSIEETRKGVNGAKSREDGNPIDKAWKANAEAELSAWKPAQS